MSQQNARKRAGVRPWSVLPYVPPGGIDAILRFFMQSNVKIMTNKLYRVDAGRINIVVTVELILSVHSEQNALNSKTVKSNKEDARGNDISVGWRTVSARLHTYTQISARNNAFVRVTECEDRW